MADLVTEIKNLAPWHLDVQVTPDVSTAVAGDPKKAFHDKDLGRVGFISPKEGFRNKMLKIYPDGMAGKTFLDCACNCGGYSFWARELGADQCYGFDVRDHWIRQARFLQEKRGSDSAIKFEVDDLYDLPNRELPKFDVTLFKGIFYHLPDPITGLKAAADLTKELLILNTATRVGEKDGMLAIGSEKAEPLMSGVYGLNWFPTGPRVLKSILTWLGFVDVRLVFNIEEPPKENRTLGGRLEIVASRTEGLLDNFEPIQ